MSPSNVLTQSTRNTSPDQWSRQHFPQKVVHREEIELQAPLVDPHSAISQSQVKKVSRRASKPIINWFQRKIAGTVRTTRRLSEGSHTADAIPGQGRGRGMAAKRQPTRVVSSPFPQLPPSPRRHPTSEAKRHSKGESRRKTISLNEDIATDDLEPHTEDDYTLDRSTNRSSLARESTWSPASALEADEDASVRPLPPSAPPSPSPSRSSSSYLSNPRTFRSIAASTKPTTVLSVDLPPNGMAHIAQVPTTPLVQATRFPAHIRTSSTGTTAGLLGSGASITFSALPPSPQSSRPSSLRHPGSVSSMSPSAYLAYNHINSQLSSVQAPQHTSHHPRNNPRPSSPPLDNASVLTLASSAFAMPGARTGVGSHAWGSSPPSALAGDSVSHLGGSLVGEGEGDGASQYVLGDYEHIDGERDVDASVRALRPRSSRRGSWDSEASGWSAQFGGPNMGAGVGMLGVGKERSLWATNSVRTGGLANDETDVQSTQEQEISENHASETAVTSNTVDSEASHEEHEEVAVPGDKESNSKALTISTLGEKTSQARVSQGADLGHAGMNDIAPPGHPNSRPTSKRYSREMLEVLGDERSIATLDSRTDIWQSAPSTPLV